MRVKKEAELAGKAVNIQPGLERLLDISNAIGQRKGNLLHGGTTGLAHVVAADRNRIPFGHVGGTIEEDVGDQPHRRARRKDIGAARDILFEDIILHRPAQLFSRNPLLFADCNHHRQQDRRRGVDRHADAHLVQRNTGK